MKRFIGVLSFTLSLASFADTSSLCTKLTDLNHCHGGEWAIVQSALDNGKTILRYRLNDKEEINFFISAENIELKEMLTSDTKIQSLKSDGFANLDWQILQTSREEKKQSYFSTLFKTTYRGNTYYGYASSQDEKSANDRVFAFLNGMNSDETRSLTGPEFKGKKYYLGWGAAMAFDPSNMQNEVKFDVLHTHDIFTSHAGGDYVGVKYTDYNTATGTNIKKSWADIKSKITSNDMYIQYSSGHGSETGLAVGVNYDQIRDQVLGFNAKESIIFIMACHSGALVDSFNKKKSDWENFQSKGKTLFVMGSSKATENSSTGPGTDPEQEGPEGSAGSAFGFSLWKALIGHADGNRTGVKDGYLSLEEIRDYTVTKTLEVGDHTPVHTGSYDSKLIMNRVPSKAFIDSLGVTSEGLTDEEIASKVRMLDQELRLN